MFLNLAQYSLTRTFHPNKDCRYCAGEATLCVSDLRTCDNNALGIMDAAMCPTPMPVR